MSNLITDQDTAWRDKANRIILEESTKAYERANFKNGKKYKKHRPYTISNTAQALVDCLNTNDEERAKAIFHRIAFGFPGEE